MKTTIRPEIFRAAAEKLQTKNYLEENTFCCETLESAGANEDERELFEKLFKPSHIYHRWRTWWDMGDLKTDYTPRVIALLLCAEIAKDMKKGAR